METAKRDEAGDPHANGRAPTSDRGEDAELRRRVAEQLALLRAEFAEAVASYSVRVQSMLAEVGDAVLEEQPSLKSGERRARARALGQALQRLEALELKPHKGRRRDLKAVERTAKELCRMTQEW